ncbi:hypothetical protein U1Q18_017797 [Sarracenia purpurea var. burkii]
MEPNPQILMKIAMGNVDKESDPSRDNILTPIDKGFAKVARGALTRSHNRISSLNSAKRVDTEARLEEAQVQVRESSEGEDDDQVEGEMDLRIRAGECDKALYMGGDWAWNCGRGCIFRARGGRLGATTGIWKDMEPISTGARVDGHQGTEQEMVQQTWTTVGKGKGVVREFQRKSPIVDIPSSSMGPQMDGLTETREEDAINIFPKEGNQDVTKNGELEFLLTACEQGPFFLMPCQEVNL